MKSLVIIGILLVSFWGTTQTFTSSTGMAIPDNNTQTCSSQIISGLGSNLSCSGPFGLESVCISINHTWDADLDIFLQAPDGTMVELTTDNGGTGDNYGTGAATPTCFTMTAVPLVTAGVAPFSAGPYRPEGNLALINNGQSGNGTWRLCITDDSGGDIGTLLGWRLTFGSSPPCPVAPTCSDGIQNQGETGVDCGGPCGPCAPTIIPTACATATYTLTSGASYTFYDDGGPGGDPCSDPGAGNFCNCNCNTTTTICGAAGEYIIADFREFAMFNTSSAFDWMTIYDGPTTSGTILFNNNIGGANNVLGDCGIGTAVINLCSAGNCLTFQFHASGVVNRAGWDALVSSVPVACGPLPVELVDFKVKNKFNVNSLTWTTASEKNSDYYFIENSLDGIIWTMVKKVNSFGNSDTKIDYSTDHRDFENALNYYRLSQVDTDGKTERFEIISIDNSSSSKTLVKTINTMGQEVDEYTKGLIIKVYSDGTVSKEMR